MNKYRALSGMLLLAAVLAGAGNAANAAGSGQEHFGLYSAGDFETTTGHCTSCSLDKAERWYFDKETIAVPKSGDLPPLVWLGSTDTIDHAHLSADGKSIAADKQTLAFAPIEKLSTNLSYYNGFTTAFLAPHPLRIRGELGKSPDGKPAIVARTIWPEDFTVPHRDARPLQTGESPLTLVKDDGGGTRTPYQTRVLWQRNPALDWSGKPVIGFMLNGAQGDDDESLGGHFGTITGIYTDGSMHDWLVNNFYGINAISEKGIIAGVTPMDKYLMDLNNGQAYYRPSYMLVAIMRNDTVARAYQADMNKTFSRFYVHDFEYEHSSNNCAGISSDGYRRLGWNFPLRGNPDKIKAIPAYAYVALTKHSLQDGRKIYDYLTAESTRLFPAVTFDAMGSDLLALAQGSAGRELTPFEKQLSEDVEAIVYVHIPQIPSSRAFGSAPVASFSEYMKQAPSDHDKWKIVPTTPHPIPDALRIRPATPDTESSVPLPVALAAAAVLALLAAVIAIAFFFYRKRKQRRNGAVTEVKKEAGKNAPAVEEPQAKKSATASKDASEMAALDQ